MQLAKILLHRTSTTMGKYDARSLQRFLVDGTLTSDDFYTGEIDDFKRE